MESMTGFGSSDKSIGVHKITVLARSVNNKGFTVAFRMPREAAHLEQSLNGTAREMFYRGRIDVSVTVEAMESGSLPEPDLDLARAYIRASEKLSAEFFLTSSPDAFRLLTLPGMMRRPEPSSGEDFDGALLSACTQAFTSLLESRKKEGLVLEDEFRTALSTIRSLSVPVAEGHSRRVEGIFEERKKRIAELTGTPVLDEGRLYQELALLSDRMDISEEHQRLSSHIDSAMEILDQPRCGRKLGFILQEMHRELNTMGSKADGTEAVRTVIEMKDILGGLREQVANVQ